MKNTRDRVKTMYVYKILFMSEGEQRRVTVRETVKPSELIDIAALDSYEHPGVINPLSQFRLLFFVQKSRIQAQMNLIFFRQKNPPSILYLLSLLVQYSVFVFVFSVHSVQSLSDLFGDLM
jgi:hypothetical protein